VKTDDLIEGLPGEAIMREGLADWTAGRRTIPGCLVAIGSRRLHRAGLIPRMAPNQPADAEHQLYQLLRQAGGDAYSRYNALLRELISFENALDRRTGKQQKAEI
jgi:hypothetical protein